MKFKVGDKVRIVGHEHIHQFFIGDIVEIICVYEDEEYYKAAKMNEECCVGGEKYLYQIVYEEDIEAVVDRKNMKGWELLREIAEDNIKKGTKFRDSLGEVAYFDGINLRYEDNKEKYYSEYVDDIDFALLEFEIIKEQEEIKKRKGPSCSIEIFEESDAGKRDSEYWFNAFSKNDIKLLDFCCELHEKQDEIIKELNKLKKELKK